MPVPTPLDKASSKCVQTLELWEKEGDNPTLFLVAIGKPGQETNTCNDQGEAIVKGDVTLGHSRSGGRKGIYQRAPRNTGLQLCHSEPPRLLPKASLTFFSHR